jgi:hypothetical protein
MHRGAPQGVRSTLVLACIFTLLGHTCAPHAVGHDAGRVAASVAEAPRHVAHDASCEALPGTSIVGLPGAAADRGTGAWDALAPTSAPTPHAPAPVPRPPRFLLFASLLN